MMLLARRRLILGGAAAVANAAAAPSRADPSSNTWPTKTIAILVPFPAEGSADLSARLLAEHLKTVLGQPVVVENKPGAGGNIAAAEAARAQGDGHMLFIGTNGTQTINQSLYRHLSYNPSTDFTAIGMMCQRRTSLLFIRPYRRDRWTALSLTHARVRASSAMARPESVRRPTSSARCSRRAPGSTWSTCPIEAKLLRSRSDWRSNCGDVSDCAGRHCVHTGRSSPRAGARRQFRVRDSVRRSAHAAARLFRSHRVGLGRALRSGSDSRVDRGALARTARRLIGERRFYRAHETSGRRS